MSEVRLPQEVQQLLERVVQREGYTEPAFHVSMATKPGDNFVGIVYRVRVDQDDKSGLSLIVKCPPAAADLTLSFNVTLFFDKEADFYNQIMPAFVEFQRDRGLTDEELSPLVPRCYHAGRDAVVLEDMSTRGYRMLDRKRTLDAAHCRLVLRSLARLHALSLTLKRARPEEYARVTRDIPEAFLVPDMESAMRAQYDESVAAGMDAFRRRQAARPGVREYVARLERFFDGYYDKLMWLASWESADGYEVINHSDCWTNNVLFGYEADQTAPASLCLLDFQAVRKCSPATDVSYFIHHCTDKSLRDELYDDLIDDYYKTLAEFVERLGYKAVDVFPRSALDDQLKRCARYALACIPFDLPQYALDLKGDNTANQEECWRRMGDVFIDMVDRGYVD